MQLEKQSKTAQLQVRVSLAEKRAIREQAERSGMTMSEWILGRVLSRAKLRFKELVTELASSEQRGFVFAELLELLGRLGASEFSEAVADLPGVSLSPYWENYLAATVEQAAARYGVSPPAWTTKIQPLQKPAFGSNLQSLRRYLLSHSPPPFTRRNIFIDAAVGARV